MHFINAKGILNGGKGRYGMNIYRGCFHGCRMKHGKNLQV